MKPFSFFLNENFSKQIQYYIVDTYGEQEYQSLVDAIPVALLDGLMILSITTKEKPKSTNPTTLVQNSSGWVSTYNKNNK